ncbi:DUF6686 family protein [Pedobacter frigoris]|uniref:DUF6686 family protein n=1 Tax=Pedobacter frigoris TaxID=2571272 RepID=UPI00292F4B7B|nr:DUF6686 family protein [Pedobacter frigoris]
MCKTRVLSTKGATVISSCIGCQVFYIWHNNLVLNFTQEAFVTFKDVLENTPFHKNSLPFPDNEERIILHTPNDDISFAFSYEEFEEFKAAISEAIYMNDVYAIMNS